MCNKKERHCASIWFKLRFIWVTNKSLEIEGEILHGAISCTWSVLSQHQVLFSSQQLDVLTIQNSEVLLD